MKNPAVVPMIDRENNEVDELRERIRQTQANCFHDFRLLEKPDYPDSKVAGIQIIFNAYYSIHDSRGILRCLKCSLEKALDKTETCPNCLDDLTKADQLELREKFFGNEYSYYRARLYHCAGCGFKGVADEWLGARSEV